MTPLFVIGGFLGAGKTTLLNAWLQQAERQRLAVLVNDFGAINIDAHLIAATDGNTIALTNGCVCCSIGDDLSAALIHVLDTQPAYDAIVIEASGVSDPWRIAQIATADPDLELGGVIVMVDSAALPSHTQEPKLVDTLQRQVASADLVVLNKHDLATEWQRDTTLSWVRSQVPNAPILQTEHARVPLQDVLGLVHHVHHTCTHDPACSHPEHHAPGAQGVHDHHEHTSLFESISWQPTSLLSPDDIRQRLRDVPPGVLRLKGWMHCQDGRWREVQYAGRHASLRPCPPPPLGQAMLVAIGLSGQLPQAQLHALL